MEKWPSSEIPTPSPTPSKVPKSDRLSGGTNNVLRGKSQDEVSPGIENRVWEALHLKGIWLPVPLFLLAICSLLLWEMPGSHESPYLLLALNFVFAMLASLLTAYLAFRAFLITGKPSSMILGCGLLIWGVNTVVAAIFVHIGPNELVTVHNLGVLLSAFCHLAAAVLRWRSEAAVNTPGLWLAAGITATVGVTGMVAIAAVARWTPVFFIPGSGGTTLRQVVLWISIGMIGLTVWLMGKEYRRSPSAFLHWYASGLSLIAVGLFGVMMQPIPGSIIGWFGRAAQFLGGAYILVAALAAIRSSRVWGLPLELVLRDTQAKLKDQIERYELVLAGASAALWDWDVPNKRFLFSPQWKALHGFDPNEDIEQEEVWRESMHPGDRERVLAALQRHFDGKTAAFSEEYRIICRDGAVKWIFDRGLAKRDATGQVIRMAGSEIEITERKLAEEALKENERRLSLAISATADAIWEWNLATNQTYYSPRWYEMLGYEVNAISMDFDAWKRLCHPDDLQATLDLIHSGLAAGSPAYAAEFRMRSKDGRWVWILGRGRVVERDEAGKPLLLSGTNTDITERKQAEEALREREERLSASLAEKEILLKEIHHRVKNNMQVISSLVDLQADEVKDDAVRGIFQDVIHRVRSMAMVHEKLYQSADLSRVDFGDYAHSLLQYLWRAQGAVNGGVQLDLDLESIPMPVNAAVPCGLILNELFSNALKHAFSGREGGRVTVRLKENGAGRVHLDVCDDGVGLPAGLDWRSAPSLGLRLVQMLARQLNAAVELEGAHGTRFTIIFEVHPS